MAGILRKGDVVWANLDPVIGHKQTEQAGQRPVLVISDDILSRHSGTVIGMAVTSKEPRAGFPLTLFLSARLGGKDAWIKITQVRTLSNASAGLLEGSMMPIWPSFSKV
jgi:mRNA interferase MazF